LMNFLVRYQTQLHPLRKDDEIGAETCKPNCR
jgi:hypothetical protein